MVALQSLLPGTLDVLSASYTNHEALHEDTELQSSGVPSYQNGFFSHHNALREVYKWRIIDTDMRMM